MESFVHITEDRVRQLLDWDLTFNAMEVAMARLSENRAFQNPRTFTVIPETKNLLLTMPGYVQDSCFGAVGCKLVTSFPDNVKKGLPSILANILLFDEDSGKLKAVISGTEITKWRTAAASAVATVHVLKNDGNKDNLVLSILGAGEQGRIHAIAFQHFFNLKEVRVWNRNPERAIKLVEELKSQKDTKAEVFAYDDIENCVKDADIIITATYADVPFLKLKWLKDTVHINAVGAGMNHHNELEESIYLNADVFIDNWAGAKTELAGLERIGVRFKGEIGELISCKVIPSNPRRITIFQSLGMATEDCAMARLIYDLYLKDQGTNDTCTGTEAKI